MRKFSLDLKVEIYNEYKKGRALQELSKEYEMNFSNLRYMVKFIDKYGIEEYIKPNHYSDDLKLYLIQRVINNEDTTFNIALEGGLKRYFLRYSRLIGFIILFVISVFQRQFRELKLDLNKEIKIEKKN